MEREIGEIFEEDGKKLQVVKDNQDNGCNGCYFHYQCPGCEVMNCTPSSRKDRASVKYIRVDYDKRVS